MRPRHAGPVSSESSTPPLVPEKEARDSRLGTPSRALGSTPSAVACLALLLPAGCTDRFISLRTEPPDAVAYLDGKEVGHTPCEVPFTWYGDRELVLQKDGFRTTSQILEISAPWWQWPIFDVLTDILLPFRFTDRHEFTIVLAPRSQDPKELEEVRKRAEELRRRAAQEQKP